MATYAIGDIQGCYDELMQLLDALDYNEHEDRLWFTGDLVNRGPSSLQVLRFVRQLGNRAITVLGNHDLHLLAIDAMQEKPRRKDTLDEILKAPDRDELLHWLRSCPLFHHDADLGYTLLHAGLPPQWDLIQAGKYAREVETVLQGKNYRKFFKHMYGDYPDMWRDDLQGWERLRFITNCFTRLRYCNKKGKLLLQAKGAPGSQPAKYLPWFRVPERASRPLRLVFGHWSTLGEVNDTGIFALDSGCLWGGGLTALRLGKVPQRITIPCHGYQRPGKD
jgi:bis(5'-nucleosyl)-tetraphosphatase (symmetrical)